MRIGENVLEMMRKCNRMKNNAAENETETCKNWRNKVVNTMKIRKKDCRRNRRAFETQRKYLIE